MTFSNTKAGTPKIQWQKPLILAEISIKETLGMASSGADTMSSAS